jgi:hypothetical protein
MAGIELLSRWIPWNKLEFGLRTSCIGQAIHVGNGRREQADLSPKLRFFQNFEEGWTLIHIPDVLERKMVAIRQGKCFAMGT